jgi:hypothetical protein
VKIAVLMIQSTIAVHIHYEGLSTKITAASRDGAGQNDGYVIHGATGPGFIPSLAMADYSATPGVVGYAHRATYLRPLLPGSDRFALVLAILRPRARH